MKCSGEKQKRIKKEMEREKGKERAEREKLRGEKSWKRERERE